MIKNFVENIGPWKTAAKLSLSWPSKSEQLKVNLNFPSIRLSEKVVYKTPEKSIVIHFKQSIMISSEICGVDLGLNET